MEGVGWPSASIIARLYFPYPCLSLSLLFSITGPLILSLSEHKRSSHSVPTCCPHDSAWERWWKSTLPRLLYLKAFFFLPLSEQRKREGTLSHKNFFYNNNKKKEQGAGEKHAAESGEIRPEEKEKGIRLPENPACEFKTPYLEAILLYFLFKVH